MSTSSPQTSLSTSSEIVSDGSESTTTSRPTELPQDIPRQRTLIPTADKRSTAQRHRTAMMRLASDLQALMNDAPEGCSASPISDDNMFEWQACVFGPSETPWEGGVFQLRLNFSVDYPQEPPRVRFVSRMFHPNIFRDGSLCLDIIDSRWSPIYTVATILTSIQSLLQDPNTDSPADREASALFSENKKAYNKMVRKCVEESV